MLSDARPTYFKADTFIDALAFGSDISLSANGRVLAIGASGEPTNGLSAGAVYMFEKILGVWVQQSIVRAPNGEAGDLFGTSVVLSGDGRSLLVGAPGEASGRGGVLQQPILSDNSERASGAVYRFDQLAGQWQPTAYLKAARPHSADSFGYPLASSADLGTVVVGAWGDSKSADGGTTAGIYSSGAAYVFEFR